MLALLASGCGASQEEDNSKYPKKKILLSTTVSEQSNATVVGKLFAERIAKETDGNIQVVVYSSDQLVRRKYVKRRRDADPGSH